MSEMRAAAGTFGERLAAAGVLGFAALCPVSIALSQICFGFTVLGVLIALVFGRRKYQAAGLELAIGIFLAVEVLAALFAVNRAWSVHALEDDWPLLFVPVFGLAMRDAREARRALRVFLAAASIVSLVALWETFSGWDPIRRHALDPIGRLHVAGGFFGQHLTWGGIVLLAASLGAALFAASPSPLSAGRALAVVAGLVVSFARTAWAGFAGALVGLALASRGRVRRAAIGALLAGGVAAAAIAPIRMRLAAFVTFHDDPRVRLWQTALRIWKDHPILGAGPGCFKLLFDTYKVPGRYMATGHPHSDFMKVLANAGVIGIAVFAFLWVSYFARVGGAYARLDPSDSRRPVLLGGILAVAAFLIGASGQCFLSDETVAGAFWFFVAAILVTARDARSVTQER